VSNIPFNDNVSIKIPQFGGFFCPPISALHQIRAKPVFEPLARFEKRFLTRQTVRQVGAWFKVFATLGW